MVFTFCLIYNYTRNLFDKNFLGLHLTFEQSCMHQRPVKTFFELCASKYNEIKIANNCFIKKCCNSPENVFIDI